MRLPVVGGFRCVTELHGIHQWPLDHVGPIRLTLLSPRERLWKIVYRTATLNGSFELIRDLITEEHRRMQQHHLGSLSHARD